MKKIIALVLVLAMVCSFMAACGNDAGKPVADNNPPANAQNQPSGDQNNQAPEGSAPVQQPTGDLTPAQAYAQTMAEFYNAPQRDKLVVSASKDGGSFFPHALGAFEALNFMFPKFVAADGAGNIVNVVAKEIEEIDEVTYRITIWDNIYDTDGNHFTTSDIQFCFDQHAAAGRIDRVNRYDHLEIIDDYTFDFCLTSAFCAGEMETNFGAIPLYTQAAFESHDFINDPVGIGPYMLKEGTYVPNSGFSIVAVEDWWYNDIADQVEQVPMFCLQNVKEIEYKILLESSSRAIGLEIGDIDLADSLDALDVAYLSSLDSIQSIEIPGYRSTSISFNSSDESLCGNLALRQAICYAIDSAAFAAGLSQPATPVYGMYAGSYDALPEWSDPTNDYYLYDKEKALELIKESGYDGTPLRMMYVSGSLLEATCLMIEAALRDVGINVEHMPVDTPTYITYMFQKESFDFKVEDFGATWLANNAKIYTAGNNTQHFDNGETIAMVADAYNDEMIAKIQQYDREEDIREWHTYFANEKCYAYAMFIANTLTAASSDVHVCIQGTALQINACY